jgi:hypothetical protein
LGFCHRPKKPPPHRAVHRIPHGPRMRPTSLTLNHDHNIV